MKGIQRVCVFGWGYAVPSEKVIITKRECDAALKMVRDGVPGGGIYIYRDQRQIGLSLRVQGASAAWVVKVGNYSKTIAYLTEGRGYRITAPMTARDMAADVIAILKSNPSRYDSYVRQRQMGVDHDEALSEAKPAVETWTLRQCFERYIEDKRREGEMARSTEVDVKLTYKRAQFASVVDQPAALIDRGQIEAVRDRVQLEVGRTASSANKVVGYTRAALEHCFRLHSGQSGLGTSSRWWTDLSKVQSVKPRERKPSIKDVVATLVLAEEFLDKPLPGRETDHVGVSAATLAGAWWLVLTCQRSGAGLALKEHDVVVDSDHDGWRLAAWDKGIMKSSRTHILPIPDVLWGKVNRLRRRSGINDNPDRWLFPSSRKDSIDSDRTSLSQSGVYRMLARLAARDKASRSRPDSVDLLTQHGIKWWSMHDVRRTLGDVMDNAGIPGGQSAILAHEIKDTGSTRISDEMLAQIDFEAQRQAAVTRMAYGAAQNLKLKRIAMQIWTDAILGEYDRQLAQKRDASEAA